MMKFPVPQFIDVEDKIIGPLTLKQFLWLLAGGGLIALLYYFGNLKFWAWLIISLPIALFFLGLAFFKIQGRPLINYLTAFLSYLIKPKLFLWQRKK